MNDNIKSGFYTIDRFEGSFAVLESESLVFFDIKKSLLPSGAKEGDIISVAYENGKQIIRIEKEKTKKQYEKIKKLRDRVFKNN